VFATLVVRVLTLAVLYAGLATLNVRGVRQGVRFSAVTTTAKLLPLLALVLIGLPAIRPENFDMAGGLPFDRLGEAALLLFFAFAGPEGAVSASGEIRQPGRTIPRGLLLGATVIVLLYVAIQTVAQGVLGPVLATEENAPLAATARQVMGPAGAGLLLAGAILSTFGTVSADLLAGPRVLFATAHDGLLPRVLARVHERFRTPYVAIVTYCLLAFTFAATGTFEFLAATASAGLLLVYLSVCLATVALQRRGVPSSEDAFRLPGGPVIPLIASAIIVWFLTFSSRSEALSLGLFLLIVSIFFFVRRWADARATRGDDGRP
jgi:basic amino acid/polyamine antiporter, APA family